MQLETSRLRLIELDKEVLRDIHELHSNPKVDEFNTLGIPENIFTTERLMNEWLEQSVAMPRISYVFQIRLADSDKFVGLIALNLGKPGFKSAEIWYKTLPNFWGKGYSTERVEAILNFGFRNLNLHRIEAGCAVDNIASVKVLQKTGFSKEGKKRRNLPIRGEWVDNYFFAILETDRKKGGS
jgi:RimJ/RimL family protein N-acetyltransferase